MDQKKKKPSYELILFLCLVMVYADLTVMEVAVLCCLTVNHLGLDRVTDSRSLPFSADAILVLCY